MAPDDVDDTTVIFDDIQSLSETIVTASTAFSVNASTAFSVNASTAFSAYGVEHDDRVNDEDYDDREEIQVAAGRYAGQWRGNTIEGYGILIRQDGSTYEGEFFKGKASGHGKLDVQGHTYDGQWMEDLAHGSGVYDGGGEHYSGQWVYNKKHGRGLHLWDDGTSYEGSFSSGMKEGFGTFFSEPGKAQYQGEFKSNKMEGRGKYFFNDGRVYDGIWNDGCISGNGVMTWANSARYEGQFVDGKRHGTGKFDSPDGGSYEGEWAMGKQNGKGVAIRSGVRSEGDWRDGAMLLSSP